MILARMRVHIVTSNDAVREALLSALAQDTAHQRVTRDEADLVVVDGDEPNADTLVLEIGAGAHSPEVLYLASPQQAATPPEGATDLMVKPVQAAELLGRFKLAHRRTHFSGKKRLELLAWAVESAGDIIEITDPSPKFEYVNPSFTRLLGFTAAEVLGKSPGDVMRSDMHDADYFKQIDETLAQGRSWNGLLISRSKDDRLVYLDSTLAPVMEADGTCTHHVAVKRDITARLQADNELRRKSGELEQARDAALEASRTKSQFLANMSHELRTPLNAIIGYAEMLAEDAEADGQDSVVADLGRIKKSGEHLLHLINDVLDISKIEAGAMRTHLESFELRSALNNVVATVQPLARSHKNTLSLEIADDIGVMRADLSKVRQILLNLLSNSSKFTEDGTITLRASGVVRNDEDWLEFQIIDTGIGIEAEALKRLFRPFVQADLSTTRRYGGTGLGLAISQRYCQMMGGEITVTSVAGEGSTFTVQMPRIVSDPEDSGARLTTPTEPPRTRRKGQRILVVDDDPAMRDLLRRSLGRQDFDVATAENGQDALAQIRKDPPDAVVLDVMMPKLDGWALLTELKGDAATADIPVVMLTVLDKSEVGFALGAVDFLLKPVQTDRLAAVLHRHLRTDAARVLVVDDDAPSRHRMRRALESAGHVVLEAVNGREGIAQLVSDPPDLVLLDLVMPEVDGFGVLEHMRETDLLSWLPVVVVTAKDLSPSERAALSGAREVLERGAFAHAELIDAVAVRVANLLGN